MEVKCRQFNGSKGFEVIVPHMPPQKWKCLQSTCSSFRKVVPGCEKCCPQKTTPFFENISVSTTVESILPSTKETGFNSPQNNAVINEIIIGLTIAFFVGLVAFILYKLYMKFKRRQPCRGFLPVFRFVQDTMEDPQPDVVIVHPEDDGQSPVQETTGKPEITNAYPLNERDIVGLSV